MVSLLGWAGVSAQPHITVDPERFSFELPQGVRAGGVINVSNDGDSLLIVRVDQGSPDRDNVLGIVVWTRHADQDWELQHLLTSLSNIGIDYRLTMFEGHEPDELEELLSRSSVLLIPAQDEGSPETLHRHGVELGGVIECFLAEHAGYMVVTDYTGEGAAFLAGTRLLDIEISEQVYPLECEAVGLHPVNAGIAYYVGLHGSNVHTSDDEDAVAVTRAVEYDGNNITARRIGRGGVVYIGMDWWQYNEAMTQLLLNAVMWSRGGSGWLLINPFYGRIAPNSSEDLFFFIETRLILEPGDYTREIVLHSNDPEQPEVRIPIELTVTEWMPAEPVFEPDEVFMITDDNVDTSQVVIVHNRGDGQLEIDICLDDPDQDWLTINRDHISIAPEGTDRLLLRFYSDQVDQLLMSNWIQFQYQNPDSMLVELPVLYYIGDDFGSVEGQVFDAENDQAVAGARVNLHGLATLTGGDGDFHLDRVPPSRYTVRFTHPEYLEHTSGFINVSPDRVTRMNVPLAYCLLQTDLEQLVEATVPPDSTAHVEAEFHNHGSGALNYRSHFHDINPARNLRPWQTRLSLASGELAGTNRLFGAVFNGDNLLISGTGNPNRIYVVSRDGELVDTIEQPGQYPLGMADLAWDGRLIYGTDRWEIIGIDEHGTIRDYFPGPFDYNRAITWDRRGDRFWVANAVSEVVAIDRSGEVLERIENRERLFIHGLAWHQDAPEGYSLYLFCRGGPTDAQVYQMNPGTGDTRFITDLPSQHYNRAGGASITPEWDPRHWTFIAQFNDEPAMTMVYNLGARQSWARLEPPAAVVHAGGRLPVMLEFNARGFRVGEELEGYFTIDGHQRGGIDTFRVIMRVDLTAVPEEDGMPLAPDEFDIEAYPNPFNDQLQIRYRAPVGTAVWVAIYDIRGRLIAELVRPQASDFGPQVSRIRNSEMVVFNADRLGSGVYLVTLKAGETRRIKRVVLLK